VLQRTTQTNLESCLDFLPGTHSVGISLGRF